MAFDFCGNRGWRNKQAGSFLALGTFGGQTEDGRLRYHRIETHLVRDFRDSLHRLTLLDFVATSGLLGGGLPMAGVNLSKNFEIDPHFMRFATPGFTASTLTPSMVKIPAGTSSRRASRPSR